LLEGRDECAIRSACEQAFPTLLRLNRFDGPSTAVNSLLTDSRSLFMRLGSCFFSIRFDDGSGRLSGMAHDD
jgi:hypothetical protein